MKCLHLSIVRLSDIRWKGTGIHQKEDSILYYSGRDDTTDYYGVGFQRNRSVSREFYSDFWTGHVAVFESHQAH